MLHVDTYRSGAAGSIRGLWCNLAIMTLPTELKGDGLAAVPVEPGPAPPASRAEALTAGGKDAQLQRAKLAWKRGWSLTYRRMLPARERPKMREERNDFTRGFAARDIGPAAV